MAVETLRSNAAGDECNINYSNTACPNHYQDVDEAEPDDLLSRVYTNNATYQRDLYNIADHSVGSGIITNIKVYARSKILGTAGQASQKIGITSGSGCGDPDTVS